jgi:hypothetical protein
MGSSCWLCGSRLFRVDPSPDPAPALPVDLSTFEARRRLDARAESEV